MLFRVLMVSIVLLSACGKKDEKEKDTDKDKGGEKDKGGGKAKSSTEAMWDKMGAYTDKVCACKSMECITKAGEAWTKEAAELAKDAGKAAELTAEDKKRSEEITKKLMDCTKRTAEDEMKKASAGGSGEQKDEPKAAEDTELQKKALEVMTKAGDAIAANEKDCKKAGGELKKLIADNKATIDEMEAWAKKDPTAMKAWEERHKPDGDAWTKKTEAGRKACASDADFTAALNVLVGD